MVAIIRPQKNRKNGGFEYFCVINGKATVINHPQAEADYVEDSVKAITNVRLADIEITRDLGKIMFAKITKFLSDMPISEEEVLGFSQTNNKFKAEWAIEGEITPTKNHNAKMAFCICMRNGWKHLFFKTEMGIHFFGIPAYMASFRDEEVYAGII